MTVPSASRIPYIQLQVVSENVLCCRARCKTILESCITLSERVLQRQPYNDSTDNSNRKLANESPLLFHGALMALNFS